MFEIKGFLRLILPAVLLACLLGAQPCLAAEDNPNAKLIWGATLDAITSQWNVDSTLEVIDTWFRTYFESRLKMPLARKIYNSDADLGRALDSNAVDIIVAGFTPSMTRLYQQGKIKPVLTIERGGKAYDQFCLLVRSDSRISSINQMRGARLGYLQEDDLHRAEYYFGKSIPHLKKGFFSEIRPYSNQRNLMIALQMKDIDVMLGTVYMLGVYEEVKSEMVRGIKPILTSPPIPYPSLFISNKLSPEKLQSIKRLTDILLKEHVGDGSGGDVEMQEIFMYFKFDNFSLPDEELFKKYAKH